MWRKTQALFWQPQLLFQNLQASLSPFAAIIAFHSASRDLPRLVLWPADVFGAGQLWPVPVRTGCGLLDGLQRLARFFSFCASASARAFAFAVRFARRPFPGGFGVPVAGVLSGCLERSARAALRTGAFKTSILHSDHISACSFITPRSPAENEGYVPFNSVVSW